jgi:alkylhydroperoxidase family enzyme
MPWIRWIEEGDAEDHLGASYQRYRGPHGIDHILKIHSLNPPSLDHHAELYEHLMRGPSGLSLAEREMIAVVVSRANDCFY